MKKSMFSVLLFVMTSQQSHQRAKLTHLEFIRSISMMWKLFLYMYSCWPNLKHTKTHIYKFLIAIGKLKSTDPQNCKTACHLLYSKMTKVPSEKPVISSSLNSVIFPL